MASLFALAQTSKLFHRLSDPYDILRKNSLEEYLVKTQYFPRWEGTGLACFSCKKILSKYRFAYAQTKGKRGLNGLQQKTRFCLQCGIQKRKYTPGSCIHLEGVSQIVCRRRLRSTGGRAYCRLCRSCEDCVCEIARHSGHPCEEGDSRPWVYDMRPAGTS